MIRLRAHRLALLAFLLPAALLAQSDKRGAKEKPLGERYEEEWSDRGAVIEKQIVEGDCKRAERSADSLLRDISNVLTGGPGSGAFVARPLRLRAVAQICQDKTRLALWDLDVAEAVFPGGGFVHPSSYGGLGQKLQEARAANKKFSPFEPANRLPSPDSAGPRLTKPELLKPFDIEYPLSLSRALKSGTAVVNMVIDERGELHDPSVDPKSTRNPVFLYSALNELRHARFAPATLDGKPVTIFYELTVNYRRQGP